MAGVQIFKKNSELRDWRLKAVGSVGFVPTMGALHAGHAALIERSVAENDLTVVSVFVNPMQFGPAEDLGRYPRTWEKDEALCRLKGAATLYWPEPSDIYPPFFSSQVEVLGVGDHWCGRSRPGHFIGVSTVVLKLLMRVKPNRLYLGQKDAQQAAIITKMVADLDLGTEVVVCPTVRELDGLALSSRNQYLTAKEREIAPGLHRALRLCAQGVQTGLKDSKAIGQLFQEHLSSSSPWRLDYFGVADPVTMQPVELIDKPVRLMAAAFLGTTRLIDNEAANPRI